jgi:hypothetical protein
MDNHIVIISQAIKIFFEKFLFSQILVSTVAYAHHSDRMVAGTEPIWIKGKVIEYRPINPHSIIILEVINDGGEIEKWTIDGPRLARVHGLKLDHAIVEVGDKVEFCGFKHLQNEMPNPPRPFTLHGKILVSSEGQKYAWGPYGRLIECVPETEWGTIYHGENPLQK